MNSSQRLQLALTEHRNGRLAQAEALYRQLLKLEPMHADTLHLLGVLCHQTGCHAEAVRLIGLAVDMKPRDANYLNNYGLALRAAGQLPAALASYQRALRITPLDGDLHTNAGNVYIELERFDEAADSYRCALKAAPGDSATRAALGHALLASGNRAQSAGRYQQAENRYREALQLAPQDAALHYNLGNALRELGKAAEAAGSYRNALKFNADDADTHNNLGNVLRELGQLDQAIHCYETALRLNPGLRHAKVHLVHQKQHICDWQGLDADIAEIRHWVSAAGNIGHAAAEISPFAFLSMPGTTAEEQRRCADLWADGRYRQLYTTRLAAAELPAINPPARKLRIGYLSADFRLHPLAFLISELIELHEHERFEIHAYSYGMDDGSAERQRLQQAFDQFHDIRLLSLHEAAQKIRADGIDILVDLTGFTQTSRSGIAVLKPATLHISWLGFPGTMGSLADPAPQAGQQAAVPLFDYLLSDAFITPPEQAQYYAEQLLLLPDSYQPNDRRRPVAARPTRAECGLPEQAFVYCCFNQSFKIGEAMFSLWMRLLQARPHSVLWLLECNRWARDNLLQAAAAHGIAAERIVWAPRVAIARHLARQPLADLFLDTLPYNAHTTASDALWMGLPLLTCTGDTFAGRVAASLLHSAGLPELVTASLAEYEELALALAEQPERLAAIRQKLGQYNKALPLFDSEKFVQALEQVYKDIWQESLDKKQT